MLKIRCITDDMIDSEELPVKASVLKEYGAKENIYIVMEYYLEMLLKYIIVVLIEL